MAVLNFDATKVEPQKEMQPLPEGAYKVAITASEIKRNKANTGSYLELKLQVLDGEYKGRTVFERLNLEHPDHKTVAFSESKLSSICHAVGVMNPTDSCQLHDRPMVSFIKVTPDGKWNDVRSFKSLTEASAEKQAAPATAGSAPWAKN